MADRSTAAEAATLDATSAGRFFELALAGIDREFPNKPGHVYRSREDLRSPREVHPVFYGHFDWHSSVHGHWTLVRLLRLFPDHEQEAAVRAVLDQRFTVEGLKAEAAYLRDHKSFERMYGWAWALRLGLELRSWDDEQARMWSGRFRPVEEAVVANAREFLPKLSWPVRCGFHPETAFPLGQILDYARGTGDEPLEALVVSKARSFYLADRNYPAAYEPSGQDFFSAGLNEADLMRRILPADEFERWLTGFLPGLAEGEAGNLLAPVHPADLHDGQLVHLVGLNLNRAWTMRSLAGVLPAGDPRVAVLQAAAARHAEAGLAQVFSGSYEGEHWLGSFAVYLLSAVGRE